MAYSHDTRPEPAAVQGTGLMAQTHCTGPGPGQEQGMRLGTMGFYIMLCTVLYTPHRDRDRYKEPLLPSINEVAEMLCFYTCLPFCPWGVSAQGGVQAPGPGAVSRPSPRPRGCTGPGGVSQHALRQTPPSRQLLLRMVHILLECILVFYCGHPIHCSGPVQCV